MSNMIAKAASRNTKADIFRNKANAARNAKFIMFGELNDTLKRIQETKSVIGTMVINHDGLAVRSSVDSTVTAQYSGLLARFTQKAMKIVKEMDPSNELNFVRVSSKTNEILIAPDDSFTLVVMQENIFMRPPEKEKVETDEINYRIRD